MDHQTFDRLTRLFGTAASRRTAWRAMLGAALFGATTRSAAAQECPDSKHLCEGECCPGKCFVRCGSEEEVFCCSDPQYVICGNRCCFNNPESADPCAECPPARASDVCPSAIAGSYRRR
jgi:hypothetical protein